MEIASLLLMILCLTEAHKQREGSTFRASGPLNLEILEEMKNLLLMLVKRRNSFAPVSLVARYASDQIYD